MLEVQNDLYGTSHNEAVPPAFRTGTQYGDLLMRAGHFFRTGKTAVGPDGVGYLDQELADFLLAREFGCVDLAVIERQPRIWRQMCLDFILQGGGRRG
jgi:hypothetical protein